MKKKLLIYAHYYIPDTASTGQILRELAEGLLENTYYDAKVALDAGRQVLYSGTACQIAGLKGYLKKEYPNLLIPGLIDIRLLW